MHARYAYHLSRVFNHFQYLDAGNPTKYFYFFILPQIYIAVKRGKTDVDLQMPPPTYVEPLLLRSGYTITTKNERVNLSWSFLDEKLKPSAAISTPAAPSLIPAIPIEPAPFLSPAI